jgi:WD40 repeat protein
MFNSDKDNDYQNGDIADGDAGDREEQADEEEEWAFDVLLDGHDSEVKSVSWSPSGSLLATCSRDKSIWIWEDLEDGDNNFETVAVLQEHSADVKCVAWHPNEDCLASGSYDNTIRLWREDVDDWGQIACLRGHDGTVWTVDWEAGDEGRATTIPRSYDGSNEDKSSTRRQTWLDERPLRGPRIVSCSDDRTVRIWRKRPRERNATAASSTGIPSIIRPEGTDETWFEETKLPHAHDLSVYSVAWSKRTGLLASTGADGRIVIYQERFTQRGPEAAEPADTEMTANAEAVPVESSNPENRPGTEWHIIAKVEAAHGIYEVNHVAWAVRGDRGVKKSQYSTQSQDAEEILLSTGDDGVVKAWKIEL